MNTAILAAAIEPDLLRGDPTGASNSLTTSDDTSDGGHITMDDLDDAAIEPLIETLRNFVRLHRAEHPSRSLFGVLARRNSYRRRRQS